MLGSNALLMTRAVKDTLAAIRPGSTTLISGPRGAGKSALLKLAAPSIALDPLRWIDASQPYSLASTPRSAGAAGTASVDVLSKTVGTASADALSKTAGNATDPFIVQSGLVSAIMEQLGGKGDESHDIDRLIRLLADSDITIAIDNVNAFYSRTGYFRPDGRPVPAWELELVDAIKKVLALPSRKSTFILATTTLPNFARFVPLDRRLSVAQLLQRDGIDVHDANAFSYEGYNQGDGGRLTREEVYEICRMRGVNVLVDEKLCDLLYTLSGGNPGSLEKLIRKERLVGLSYEADFRTQFLENS